MAFDKPLDDLIEDDLVELLTAQVAEGKFVEYKRSLPGGSDEEKREFLADVSSFANAGGGHLIYGIEEENGVPVAIKGLGIDLDPDAELLRLDGIARSGLDPRLPQFELRPVPLSDGKGVAIVIRIGASWIAPHMVTFRGSSRFFSRTSAGKYQLSVSEIRSSVLLSESGADGVRDFRIDRVAKIRAGETSVVLGQTGKVMLQVVPFGATGAREHHLDPRQLRVAMGKILPLYGGVNGTRFNFDGFLMYDSSGDPPDDEPVSYLQLFRDGSIEAVDAQLLRQRPGGEKVIPITQLERCLIEGTGSYLRFLRDLGIDPPFFVMVTLIDVRHYLVPQPRGFEMRFESHLIDREILAMPEIVVTDFDIDVAKTLKPALDAIWQAGDWPGSPHFDPTKGTWMGPRPSTH